MHEFYLLLFSVFCLMFAVCIWLNISAVSCVFISLMSSVQCLLFHVFCINSVVTCLLLDISCFSFIVLHLMFIAYC